MNPGAGPEAEPDAALVERAARGDAAAFAVLARRHGPRMARTARGMGVPAPEVEDVTQAALVAAWRSLLDYDPRRPFASWACAIAANKARDWRRHRQRRRLWLDAEPLDSGAAAAVADAGQDPEMAEALRRVAAALDRLPGHLREPLVLTAVSGLSYAEAAQALGISVKAAETRIRRARDQLARLLEPR